MRCVDENHLSHHFLEDVAVHQEPAEKSEGTGRGGGECAQASHNLTRKAQGGCHLNFWGFPSAKNSQGTSLLYPLLSHKKKKKNPCESSSSVWKST